MITLSKIWSYIERTKGLVSEEVNESYEHHLYISNTIYIKHKTTCLYKGAAVVTINSLSTSMGTSCRAYRCHNAGDKRACKHQRQQ